MGPSRGHGVPAPSTEPGTEQLLGNHHTELEISLTPATLGVTVFKSSGSQACLYTAVSQKL